MGLFFNLSTNFTDLCLLIQIHCNSNLIIFIEILMTLACLNLIDPIQSKILFVQYLIDYNGEELTKVWVSLVQNLAIELLKKEKERKSLIFTICCLFHNCHQSLIQTMLRSAACILFFHSNISRVKSLDSFLLHEMS